MLPSRRNQWPLAYFLMTALLPILAFATWQHGAIVGLLLLGAAASVLRWPLYYFVRWVRQRIFGTDQAG